MLYKSVSSFVKVKSVTSTSPPNVSTVQPTILNTIMHDNATIARINGADLNKVFCLTSFSL